jgi:hypothetical protein
VNRHPVPKSTRKRQPAHSPGALPMPAAEKKPTSPSPAPASRATAHVFSEELHELARRFQGRPVTLGDLFEATQGRGYHFVLLLISLPFVTPIPLPGVSIPFGIVVAVLGARMAIGQKPWLPARLLRRTLPPSFLEKLLPLASRVVRWLEYFLKPRLPFVKNHEVFSLIAGLFIAISGLFLILPLPLPFSNSLPAWTVIFLAAGAIGRDGLFFIAGCVSFAVSVAYFTALSIGGVELVEKIRAWLTGG